MGTLQHVEIDLRLRIFGPARRRALARRGRASVCRDPRRRACPIVCQRRLSRRSWPTSSRPQSSVHLPAADTVLYAVGYDRACGVSIHEVFVDGLQRVARRAAGRRRANSFTSARRASTDSRRANGSTKIRPASPSATAGGLPGRRTSSGGALLGQRADHFADGRAVWSRTNSQRGRDSPQPADRRAPSTAHLNLIHVDDAASVVLAAAERAQPPRTYRGLRRPSGPAASVLRRVGPAAAARRLPIRCAAGRSRRPARGPPPTNARATPA